MNSLWDYMAALQKYRPLVNSSTELMLVGYLLYSVVATSQMTEGRKRYTPLFSVKGMGEFNL